jgi:Ubiquitin carboxyl-terminal hydrolase/DUSP domain
VSLFLLLDHIGGTRKQRLQLLFFLLLPPKTFEKFLASHPAGGVPFWLLEVGTDIVFSLASMAHYHLYGHSFLPADLQTPHKPFAFPISKDIIRLNISANGTQDLLGWLIKPPPNSNRNLDANAATTNPSSTRRIPPNRRGSNNNIADGNNQGDPSDIALLGKTEVMERLLDVAEGKQLPTSFKDKEDPAMEISRRKYLMAQQPVNGSMVYWSMEEFSNWAEEALDDLALDTVMHSLFATGVLPSYSMEKELVENRWVEWQSTAREYFMALKGSETEDGSTFDYWTSSVRKLVDSYQNGVTSPSNANGKKGSNNNRVWGGIGGFDGRGAMGFGILYCIDKKWWSAWEAYVGWTYDGAPVKNRTLLRPGELSTEALLDRDPDANTGGLYGSYEAIKQGLKRDVDYVLVPQGVWDVLYELYGGGPPLPRPVLSPENLPASTNVDINTFEATFKTEFGATVADTPYDEVNVDTATKLNAVLRIPRLLSVALHPWIIHVHLCDPQQPYRRGDVGPLSIRLMACPNQPLWRLFAEAIVRLPLQNLKAYHTDGRGRARLWKKTTPTGPKDPLSRYGPWTLLCKNRHGKLPMVNYSLELEEHFSELQEDWEAYADKASLEGAALADGNQLMLECAILNKSGDFLWPREAAAKAGRVRRLADEDMKFRQMLRGIDENGEPLENPPMLVGMLVDAMDSSGRWYQVEILKVEIVTVEVDGGDDNASGDGEQGESKQVKVDFTEFGGHPEWIDTESDRLATAGRFTLGRPDDSPTSQRSNNANSNSHDAKSKPVVTAKKSNTNDFTENGKVCSFPGYGACGLANLGNTCYINSAIQCISYMPLLRSYLLSAQYKATGDLNRDNPFGTGGKLLEEFAELLRLMWSARHGEKSPTRFRTQLGKANSQFLGADQQDAQEFLNYMLDKVHEDSNKIRKKPYVLALEDDWVKVTKLARVGDEAWRRYVGVRIAFQFFDVFTQSVH